MKLIIIIIIRATDLVNGVRAGSTRCKVCRVCDGLLSTHTTLGYKVMHKAGTCCCAEGGGNNHFAFLCVFGLTKLYGGLYGGSSARSSLMSRWPRPASTASLKMSSTTVFIAE